ncbi:EPIDERMAL PATTERNING FACTOR-like protein 2 [Euphorbia peplus]|nr:EPIDERMAL PATTERNING FACTOR-like protein 2 [Euphorbia peplus]
MSYIISISLLCILISSSTQFRFIAEGRVVPKSSFSQKINEEEERMLMRSQIGSRPPRCERRCSSCVHCEAIQVPTNPQINHHVINNTEFSSSVAYARGDDASNYKPMSWKCKCGNLIFNP